MVFRKVKLKGLSSVKLAFYYIVASLISVVFSFFGAPILKVLEQNTKPIIFWLLGALWLGMSFYLPALPASSLMVMLWFSVGLQGYLDKLKPTQNYLNLVVSLFFGVTISLIVAYLSLFLAQKNPVQWVEDLLGPFIQNNFLNTWFNFEIKWVYLLPSLFWVVGFGNLVFAQFMDRKMALWLDLPYRTYLNRISFLDYRNPEYFIWVFLICLFGTFFHPIPESIRLINANGLIILFGFYFFQGLAVLESVLLVIRAGLFIRILVYVLIVGQMSLIMISLGLIDYWVDVRKNFIKWFKAKE